MPTHLIKRTGLPAKRRDMYSFAGYNPYQASDQELPLVEENLARLKAGEISLRGFLRQTPHFARWKEQHIRQARVLLVTNELGLSGIEKAYGGIFFIQKAAKVAELFHETMLSWLSLTDHPNLGGINGEAGWCEGGGWESAHPALATCGRAGSFLTDGEESALAGCQVLHIELSPFGQANSREINPRNDQGLDYHRENLHTVRRFCALASPGEPRYLFIVGNRASIRQTGNIFRLEATRTQTKDKSRKIIDLLRVTDSSTENIQMRLCRHWPAQGRDVEVFEVVRPLAFALRPMEGNRVPGISTSTIWEG